MDKAEMLARVRMFLDESTEDYYLDDEEIYPALSLAQLEIAKTLSATWKERVKTDKFAKIPVALDPLREAEGNVIVSGQNSFSFVLDPLVVISCIWQFDGVIDGDTPYAIEIGEHGVALRIIRQPLLADGTYFWWNQENLFVNPVSTNASSAFIVIFIKTPVDITASVNPEIGAVAHDAVVERALWILMKDREVQVAQSHLQLYGSLIQGLL